MQSGELILRYVVWHYTRALRDLVRHIRRFAWFLWHFFSIGVLFRTWVSPWKRMNEEKHKKGISGDLFERIVINSLMRIVGFLIRGLTMLVGFLAIIVEIVLGIFVLGLWIVMPLLVVGMIGEGIRLLFV